MPRRRYTKEQIDYLREIAKGRYLNEITNLFNQKFGLNLTESQIKNLKTNYKITSGVPNRRITGDEGLFTKVQKEFIKQHVKGRTNKELTDLINKTFNLSITTEQMRNYKRNHGLSSGLDFRFKKGHTPWNKGVKGLDIGGKETRFKKGHKPANYLPVGTERVSKDGYVIVKISDEGTQHQRWKRKHVLIWEQANGPVPEGHVVIFGDGNRRNFDLSNLILVPREHLARMAKLGLFQNDAELTRTGLLIAEIHKKISERRN